VSYVVVAFTKFAKESEKTFVTLWILSRPTKNLFLIAEPGGYHYPRLPRMLPMYPA